MFLGSLFAGILRRQSSLPVPGACYDACNNATIEPQQVGKSPSICEANSDFSQAISSCQTCVDQKRSNSTSGFEKIQPVFQQFLDYCANTTGTNETLVGKVASYQSAVSSFSAVSASLASDAALLGLTTSTLVDNTTTILLSTRSTSSIPFTSSFASSLSIFPPSTSTPSLNSAASPHRNAGGIAGATVGSIFGVAVLLIAACFILGRRNRRHTLKLVGNEAQEKPMLHSDDFRPDREELPGDKPATKGTLWTESMTEMPVNETVGAELDAWSGISRR